MYLEAFESGESRIEKLNSKHSHQYYFGLVNLKFLLFIGEHFIIIVVDSRAGEAREQQVEHPEYRARGWIPRQRAFFPQTFELVA